MKESAHKTVKLGDYKNALTQRIVEGRRVKGIHNTPKINFSKWWYGSNSYLGVTRNAHMIDHQSKGRALINDKELLRNEVERKRAFTGKIKGLIHNTNFLVGTNDPDFERKEVATIENPEYEYVVLDPKPHKNITTFKLKYEEGSTFANSQPHSKTMDINRVEETTLTLTQRPKILSHLKHSTLKF
jgi:hypothetical protein